MLQLKNDEMIYPLPPKLPKINNIKKQQTFFEYLGDTIMNKFVVYERNECRLGD